MTAKTYQYEGKIDTVSCLVCRHEVDVDQTERVILDGVLGEVCFKCAEIGHESERESLGEPE